MKMTKRESKVLEGLKIGNENEIVTNPFSKEQVELCPEAVALYDVIMGCYITINNNLSWKSEKTYEMYDIAKIVFYNNWPKEYMLLID